MKHGVFVILFTCFNCSLTTAQCETYFVEGNAVFHANDIRTHINTAGEMFWYQSVGQYQVPYSGYTAPNAIYAGAIWIGGYDSAGELKLAAQMFRGNGAQLHDFSSGPLTENGFPYGCSEWDTIWSVARYEILAHIQDFDDDGVVDNHLKAIYGWPGAGNPFFFSFNGFSIPDHIQEFAPFYDANQDGVYRPDRGDYPLPYGFPKDVIPDQISWHVFHDVKEHKQSQGDPLHVEIHQTCYAFYCNDARTISQSLFMDFNIINRNSGVLDSVFFGLWLDPDIGCASDDHIGCLPEENVFFAYNSDAIDGDSLNTCSYGVVPYRQGPPALSGTFLTREMSSFLYFNGAPHPFIERPFEPIEYYRLLTGLWADGQLLTIGGDGYNPAGGYESTKFAFDGDPNDSSGWSMIHENLEGEDRRIIPSTSLGTLDPGQSARVSMALTLHLDPVLDHLGNVALMYSEFPIVKSQYSSGFNLCSRLDVQCVDPCVWPGDANNDGIANHHDLLILGMAHSRTGLARTGPLSWAPHNADNWEDELPGGINVKYADTNGDGVVEIEKDAEIIDIHYGLTHADYHSFINCNEGEELIVEGGYVGSVISQTRKVTIRLNTALVDSLYGLAFSVLFDQKFFRNAAGFESPFFPAGTSHSISHVTPGRIDFAVTRFDRINDLELEATAFFTLYLYLADPIPDEEGNDTTELCIANAEGILKDGTNIAMGANKIQFIFLDENATGVSDIKHQAISVYPNPTGGRMRLEVPSDMIGAQYEIRQMSGQLYSSRLITNEITQLVLPAGIYVLNIRSQEKQFVEKLVVLE
jgi:hypothetical protein